MWIGYLGMERGFVVGFRGRILSLGLFVLCLSCLGDISVEVFSR